MAENFMRIAKVDFEDCNEGDMSFEHEDAINDELDNHELVKFPNGWYLCMEVDE